MGLDSSTMRLRASNDALEASQTSGKAAGTHFRSARVANRRTVERLDAVLGRAECGRALDALLPRLLDALGDATLRTEAELLLTATREHLR